MRQAPALQDLEALSALADPARRALYDLVCAAGRPVGREEAAAASGIGRSLVAYHLDRLARSGLLEVSYGRPHGRGGPGAGRPAKLYRRAEREFVLRTPPRDYGLLAEIFLRADEADAAARSAVERAARVVGEELGHAVAPATVEDVLRLRGYEPFEDDGTLRFGNCPFHSLAETHRSAVCSLNLALVEGILAGTGTRNRTASLEPDRAACCVALRPRVKKR
jgi:predicted ArsR family transcriptional regulator